MMYIHQPSLARIKADLSQFISAGTPKSGGAVTSSTPE
jgi:hypothetical protein